MRKEQLPQLHQGETVHYAGERPRNYRRTARPELLPAFTPFTRQDAARLSAALALPSKVSVTLPSQIPELGPDNYIN